jgi:hypothetical protein
MNSLSVAAFMVGLLGFAALIAGVALMSVPLALIVGGAMAILWSGFTARALARQRKG